eukprot:Rhum_TRINITY_DN12196_c0_g1::Rhum_TRINITY_DN12196_c0_g1_i1::g.49938::m.49938
MGCSDSKDAGKPAAPAAAATTDEATDLHKKEEILRKVRAEQARLVQEAERAHQQVMQMRDIEELSRRRRLECPTEAAPTEAGGSDGGDGPEAPVTAAAAAAAVGERQQQQPLDLPMVEVTVAAPEEEHGREEDAAPADAGADNQLRPSIYRRGEGAAQHGASAYMLSTNMIAFDGAPDPTSCVMYLPDDFGNGSDDDTAADDELVVTHGWKEKEGASA